MWSLLGTVIRETYSSLVSKGLIVPKPEIPPPAIPMDYASARVRFLFLFSFFIILTLVSGLLTIVSFQFQFSILFPLSAYFTQGSHVFFPSFAHILKDSEFLKKILVACQKDPEGVEKDSFKEQHKVAVCHSDYDLEGGGQGELENQVPDEAEASLSEGIELVDLVETD